MKPGVILVAAIALLPPVVGAVSKELSGRQWVQQVPPLPASASSAYAQWIDDNDSLKPGSGFKAVEDGLGDIGKDQAAATMASPQMQQQMAMAQQMQQQYGSPEGQAKLRSMTPAQVMAMAQQFQPPPIAGGPVSEHDQALIRQIAVYPATAQIQADIQKIRAQQLALDQQWRAQRDALGRQEQQGRNALPICHSEAGEPSSIAVRDLTLEFADQRIALATAYLPKYQPLVQQLRTLLLPRIDHGDAAMAAWAQLENPALKQQMATVARGAYNAGLADVGLLQSFIEDISKQAAQTVADRSNAARVYAKATGC